MKSELGKKTWLPSWERPIRIPEHIALLHADPDFALAGATGSWTLRFQLSRAVGPHERLLMNLYGAGSNRGGFLYPQCRHRSGYGYVSASHDEGGPLPLTRRADKLEPRASSFFVGVPPDGFPAGTRITVVLGDRSHGGPGIRANDFCVRNKFFLLYTHDPEDALEDVYFHAGNWDRIVAACVLHVIGGPIHHLRAYAPSAVTVGEPFAVSVRPQDRYGNLSSQLLGDVEIRRERRILPAPVRPLEDSSCVHAETALDREGVFRLQVRDPESGRETVTNPILCTQRPPPRKMLWGMIHGHSEMSDGLGTLHRYFRQLRDECLLDFGAPGDHDALWDMTEGFWEIVCRRVREYHDPGRFVTFLGYEFARWRRCGEGDRNVYYLEDNRPMYRSHDGHYPWPNDLFRAVKDEKCLIIPHHTAHANSHCDWEDHDPIHERLAEIFQLRGSYECSEEDGNPVPEIGYAHEKPNPVGYVRNALAMGWRVGFTAGGDDHSGRAGTDVPKTNVEYSAGNMSVAASGRTREAIWEALWNRRVVATTGPRMVLVWTLNGHDMGSELDARGEPELRTRRRIRIEFHGTAPVKSIEVIRSGRAAHCVAGAGPDMEVTWDDESPHAGIVLPPAKYCARPFAYYYVRVLQEDGEVAWASPVWIDGE